MVFRFGSQKNDKSANSDTSEVFNDTSDDILDDAENDTDRLADEDADGLVDDDDTGRLAEGSVEDDLLADDPLTDDEDGEWLAIELHEWASETRSMLAQLLLADGVVHSWQGTTLLAHYSLEAQVDALIEEAEKAETRALDPQLPQLAFEMSGWPEGLQTQLSERLGSAGVPHEFDADGDLVCHEDDEEHVELLIEDLLARAGDLGLEELEGLQANDLLSAMFEATDRLRRDVRDAKGVLGAVTHGQRIAASATPFGFSATTWSALRETADQLVELIDSDHASDKEIRELATALRDTLQRLI